MKSEIKKLWFKSLITSFILIYLIPIITKIIEIWIRDWDYYSGLNTEYLTSILFFQPIYALFLIAILYYYVYKLEHQYVLKIIIILSCLTNIHIMYRIVHYSNKMGNIFLESIIRDCLLFYVRLFYCITSYRLYTYSKSTLNILIPISISSITYITSKLIAQLSLPLILQQLNSILFLLITIFCLLPDSIQLLTFNYVNNIFQKIIKK